MMTSLCLSTVGLAQTPALAQVRPTHIERFRSPRAQAESAEGESEASLASDPANVEALNARALARARLGRFQEAYDDLQRAAVLNPTKAETQANLGYILWNLGRKTEARRAEQAAIGLDNNNLTAHHQLGRF